MLVGRAQGQPAGQPEQFYCDREWAVDANLDMMHSSRDMIVGPMTDSFVQILHQIHDPDAQGDFISFILAGYLPKAQLADIFNIFICHFCLDQVR